MTFTLSAAARSFGEGAFGKLHYHAYDRFLIGREGRGGAGRAGVLSGAGTRSIFGGLAPAGGERGAGDNHREHCAEPSFLICFLLNIRQKRSFNEIELPFSEAYCGALDSALFAERID